MITRRTGRGTLAVLFPIALVIVVTGGAMAAPTTAQAEQVAVAPMDPTIESGSAIEFRSYVSPDQPTGPPNFGPDGVPGTADDNFTPAAATWELFGIGTLTPGNPDGSGQFFSATFTATLPPGSTFDGAGIMVTVDIDPGPGVINQIGSTSVFIIPATTPPPPPPPPPPPAVGRLTFLDELDEETSELTLLRLGFVHSLFLAQLTTGIARREATGRQATRGELRLLRRLVSSDFRHRVAARDLPPGTGGASVVSTVTSYAPDGSVLDEVDVILQPDGSGGLQMQQQMVFVDPATRNPRRPRRPGFSVPSQADGLVFLTAVDGGRVVARAANFTDGQGQVIIGAP